MRTSLNVRLTCVNIQMLVRKLTWSKLDDRIVVAAMPVMPATPVLTATRLNANRTFSKLLLADLSKLTF